jgi:hypothetical protein
MKKLPQVLVVAVGSLLVGLTVLRITQSWPNDSHLDHVSGAWVALAADLRSGVFYRPPFGPVGYGGTRFFPLFFCLHAAGMAVTGSWRFSGYLLSAISIMLLLSGVYYLLCKLAVERWLCLAGCAAVLAGSSVQDAFLTIREDGLAAALNVWGVVLGVEQPSRRRLYALLACSHWRLPPKKLLFSVRARSCWHCCLAGNLATQCGSGLQPPRAARA